MNKAAKQFWGIVQGSLIVFTLLVVAYALNSLGALRSFIGYYSWLPNTQSAFNEFLKQLGIIGIVGSLFDIIALVARWVRYLFQHPFFS